jgi:hypothetical protein
MSQFTFGLTLSGEDRAVYMVPDSADRHHSATAATPITLNQPSRTPDFILKPFNRGDAYTIKVYICAAGKKPGEITFGSSEAIRFVEMPSGAEIMAKAATGIFPLWVQVLKAVR